MGDEIIDRFFPGGTRTSPKPARYRAQHTGMVSPVADPYSGFGVKSKRAKGTMGPGSGEVLVDPRKYLLAHSKDNIVSKRE